MQRMHIRLEPDTDSYFPPVARSAVLSCFVQMYTCEHRRKVIPVMVAQRKADCNNAGYLLQQESAPVYGMDEYAGIHKKE